MSDEPGSGASLFGLTLDRKSAAEWVFRCFMLASFWYLKANYVPIDKYERDQQNNDAKEAIVLAKLDALSLTLKGIDEDMKQDSARDGRIEKIEVRVHELEVHPNAGR